MSDDAKQAYIDADGHVLEHPTEMLDYAPPGYEDRVWHIETEKDGSEWAVHDGVRRPANGYALAGTAGMSPEDRERARRGELKYTEVRPAAWDAKARLDDMDAAGIDKMVLYPTLLLGIQSHPDVDFAAVQCRVYNDWLADHLIAGDGRLFGVAVVPQQDIGAAADEIRRVSEFDGIVGVLLRPNPTEDWKPLNDSAYDPIWRTASETGLTVGFHPYLAADLPGACLGLRINKLRTSAAPIEENAAADRINIDNIYFTQAISNPFDMMNTMTFLLAGGVCERYPDLRIVFLESGGGWLVPWLERLDHHAEVFSWDVPDLTMAPSEYFRRQCWISFDPDESMLAFTAESPLCGADRIVWASDYPHPDAVFPGVVDELDAAIDPLRASARRSITGANALALYAVDPVSTVSK